MGDDQLTLTLPPLAASVRRSRHFVADTLAGWQVDPGLVDVAALLTSEVVTNALLHARTPFTVTVDRTDAAVTVGVADGSPVQPRHHRPSAEVGTTGRGLSLLDELASDWSVDAGPTGKTVTFRLDLPSRLAPSGAGSHGTGGGGSW